MVSGVYAILNTGNSKVYIGSNENVYRCWERHQLNLKRGKHPIYCLQQDWNKYGKGAFAYFLVEEVLNEEKRLIREQFHIDKTRACQEKYGYNSISVRQTTKGLYVNGKSVKRICRSGDIQSFWLHSESDMNISGIYLIYNKQNHRVYVGSSRNVRQRWNQHRTSLRANKHDVFVLQRDWNRYGEDAFEFHLIEVVEERGNLREREQVHIDDLLAQSERGYNSANAKKR